MRNIVKVMLLLNVIFFVGIICIYASDNTLRFELTKDKIEKIWIYKISEGNYEIVVKLNKTNKEIFYELTAKNVGKRLTITFKDHILVSAIIKGEIDSGIISLGVWKSLKEAERMVEFLKSE